MIIDFAELNSADAYFAMTQAVIPRPVAWTLTQNDGGGFNLAPFSYFNAVCSSPPLVMISIGLQPDGGIKDTLANIRRSRRFVAHIASGEMLHSLNESSATLPYGESEIARLNLPLAEFDFALPRVEKCKLALGCELVEIKALGKKQSLIFGEIKKMFADDSAACIDEKNRIRIAAEKINPVCRLGANEYASFGDKIFLRRPK